MRALSAPLAFEDPTNSQRIRGGSFRMKRTQYRIQPQTREALARRLAEELEKEPAVRFGYLYGSRLDFDTVHDVDVGHA
jgi:hypothetical protein